MRPLANQNRDLRLLAAVLGAVLEVYDAVKLYRGENDTGGVDHNILSILYINKQIKRRELIY